MIPAYVISLSGSSRRVACSRRLSEAGVAFSFVDAVDGRRLEREVIERVFDRRRNGVLFKRDLSPAEIGCYLSHLEIWRGLAQQRAGAALVLEDDCVVDPRTAEFLAALEGFDLADVVIKLDGPRLRARRVRRALEGAIAGVGLVELEIITPFTTGYVIGHRAAARMAAVREQFFRPVDTDMKFVWEHGVPILATDPVLVRADSASESSINAEREALKPKSAVVRLARNLRYQADFYLRRRRASSLGPVQLRRRDESAYG